jgi:hypothetical protein
VDPRAGLDRAHYNTLTFGKRSVATYVVIAGVQKVLVHEEDDNPSALGMASGGFQAQ